MKIATKRDALKTGINKIKEYLAAKERVQTGLTDYDRISRLYESDPGAGLQKFMSLADEPKMDDYVRIGEIYSFLILHNVKRSNFKKAHQLLQQYQTKKTSAGITEFVSTSVLDQICDEVKAPRITKLRQEDLHVNDEVEFSHALRRKISSAGGSSDDDENHS